MKILITTGVYPPKIGGPAQYTKNLEDSLRKLGHVVDVKTFTTEDKIPSGFRHIFFMLKIITSLISSDVLFIMDTFSVAMPTVFLAKIFNKKSIIRTGGDFLWEQYVERTGRKVLFTDFYKTEAQNFSLKEKIIFNITKWVLNNTSHVIFSTDWQKDIFMSAYNINPNKVSVVENYYGSKESDFNYNSREFVASSRKSKLKNIDTLKKIFNNIKKDYTDASVFIDQIPFKDLMDKMKYSYATILVSFGDISPNLILDSIRYNRPFICTKEVGIYERIKDAGIFVDPMSQDEIEKAVRNILTENGYNEAKEKVRNFNFVHTWDDIAREFIEISKKI